MINQETVNKLIEMRLTTMAEEFKKQISSPSYHSLCFEERFGLLVDAEYTYRINNKLYRLIKKATLDQPHASIEDINYKAGRKLNKSEILRLSTCDYIEGHHNIIILGATGAGKSYLSCAFGMEACKKYYATKYIRLPELLMELNVALAENTFKKLIQVYNSVKLLIIDDWMLSKLNESDAKLLLEIIHARHKKASTIFCSQFDIKGWHQRISEPTMADAILDRIVYDSYVIEINSDSTSKDCSMREEYGIKRRK